MPGAGGQASAAQIPWGWLGHVEATADQGAIVGTAVDLTNLSVAVTAGTSRRLLLTASVYPSSTAAADIVTALLMEGATQLQVRAVTLGAIGIQAALFVQAVLTPSAGAHTYKVQMRRAAGTGTITNGAGATFPSFLLVQDVGPST